MNSTITLSHHDRGEMRVSVWDEATLWMKKRTWTCVDDPELGSFEDEDFDEHYSGEIDKLLVAAVAKPETSN